jgi:hypothetical protein
MVTTADIKGKFMLNLCTDQIYKTQYSKLNRPARQWSSISRQIWLNWLRSRPIPEANSWYFKAYSMKHLQVDYFRLSFNLKKMFWFISCKNKPSPQWNNSKFFFLITYKLQTWILRPGAQWEWWQCDGTHRGHAGCVLNYTVTLLTKYSNLASKYFLMVNLVSGTAFSKYVFKSEIIWNYEKHTFHSKLFMLHFL